MACLEPERAKCARIQKLRNLWSKVEKFISFKSPLAGRRVGSVSCGIIAELLADPDVAAYVKSQKCKDCILPVQTGMCDNFKGWGNFAENVLGIKSNVCINHTTGNVQFFCAVACDR